jgi:predicted nuclease with TOPRIM domain
MIIYTQSNSYDYKFYNDISKSVNSFKGKIERMAKSSQNLHIDIKSQEIKLKVMQSKLKLEFRDFHNEMSDLLQHPRFEASYKKKTILRNKLRKIEQFYELIDESYINNRLSEMVGNH